ncbi:MAG TPA: ABC transporter permease [Gemmatimonadaceae bacterium]|nr:ABC transporter permease [Gemmatimonadaceae bacterium]
MDSLIHDLRYAVRSLTRTPAFTCIAVVCLALGIGANSTMFSVIDALFLKPPAVVQDPGSIVRLYVTRRSGYIQTVEGDGFAYPDYTDLRDNAHAFAGLATTHEARVSFGRGVGARQLDAMLTSAGYFSTLGVHPVLGRFFVSDEEHTPGAHPVAVLAYRFWQRQFAGDRGVIGRAIILNGHPFTVVGVAPEHFNGIDLQSIDLWAPMMQQELGALTALTNHFCACYSIFGRLATGMTQTRAAAEASTILRHADESIEHLDHDPIVTLGPVNAAMGPGRSQPATVALWLSIVTGVVLLIACANVANLLLVRAARRRREIALRLSLGVGRGRLVRQLLTESILLALLGGVCGLLLASWGTDLVQLFPLPPIEHLIDVRVLTFTALLSTTTGIVFGLVPAWQASRLELVGSLKDGAGGQGHGRSRLRGGLLATQVALSVVLLIGAGLLVRSLRNVQAIDTGMELDHTLLVSVDLGKAGYAAPAQRAFYSQALGRLRALRGVQQVSSAEMVPLYGVLGSRFTIPGRDSLPYSTEGPYINGVGSDFFATMGIPLRLGRAFTDGDRAGTPLVVIVNEAMARLYWPGRNPIGQCIQIRTGGADSTTPPCSQVVGVVANTRYQLLGDPSTPGFYVPILQRAMVPFRTLFVRTASSPAAMITLVRRAMQTLAPDLPFVNVTPMSDVLGPQLLPFRLGALLFTIFGGVALLLAVIGLYGVIAYSVAQRTREIGVRMALGAQRTHVLRLVVRQGVMLTLIGIGGGAGIAMAGTRLMRSMLYGVSATDPLTFAGIALMLVVVAVVACWIPARRAASIDPVESLRAE